jgi:hypothetical protein
VNFSVTDPTSSSNVFDASSLSAILILDIIRLAPAKATEKVYLILMLHL